MKNENAVIIIALVIALPIIVYFVSNIPTGTSKRNLGPLSKFLYLKLSKQKDPPELSYLQTPDDWYVKREDSGYIYADEALLPGSLRPAHYVQHDKFEGQVSIRPGSPSFDYCADDLANAWAMLDILKGEKTPPDEWKGKQIVFAGSRYYRTRPYTLGKSVYYVEEDGYGPRRKYRAHYFASTIYGIYDGTVVPVLYYRDTPKKILVKRSWPYEYEDIMEVDVTRKGYYTVVTRSEPIPPGWDVEFISIYDLKGKEDLFFAVVPEGTQVLNTQEYKAPKSRDEYQSDMNKEVDYTLAVEYEVMPVSQKHRLSL